MLTVTQNVDYHRGYAVARAGGVRKPLAFLISTMLAGAYIGIADVFMFTAAGPMKAAGDPWAPLISGLVFGIGLILCVFAGGELATSAMMTFTIGGARKSISWGTGVGVLAFMLVGNLLGSIVVAGIVHLTGVLGPDTAGGAMLAAAVLNKGSHYTALQLFTRGIMCNVLVCLAIWCVTRSESEVGKMIAMAWCLAAFVTSGFEHVVANMTTFSLGIFAGLDGGTLGAAARNLLIVGAGNIVGGAVFVALAYLAAHRIEDGAAQARAELAARDHADAGAPAPSAAAGH